MNSKRERIPLLFWFLVTAVLLVISLALAPMAFDGAEMLRQMRSAQPPALPMVATALPAAPLTNSLVSPPATAVPQPPAIPQPAAAADTGTSARSAPPAGNGQAAPAVVAPAVIPEQEQLNVFTATGEYDAEFLLACWTARQDGRRVSPRCPGDEAALLGSGR